MVKQAVWQVTSANKFRAVQFFLLIVFLWFVFWAHIYEMVLWNKTFAETLQASSLNILLYSAALIGVFLVEIYLRRTRRVSTALPTSGTPKALQVSKNKSLKTGDVEPTKMPSNKIGIIFLAVGILLLILSYVFASVTLAFIGLSLTFWGALFLFIRSTNFVRNTILDVSLVPSYKTMDRILADLEYTGKALYIPPYPKDAYLPEHLSGMKDQVVFIPAKDSTTMPSIEEISQKQFLVKNPKGVCVFPPGSGLVNAFEKELSDFTNIDRENFYDELSAVITNNLELAAGFEIDPEGDLIHVTITDSVYRNLYSKEQKLRSVHFVGCPLVSAVSCALAITTGRPVTIAKTRISLDLKTIEIWYQIIEG